MVLKNNTSTVIDTKGERSKFIYLYFATVQSSINREISLVKFIVVGCFPVGLMPRINILNWCLPQQFKATQITVTVLQL